MKRIVLSAVVVLSAVFFSTTSPKIEADGTYFNLAGGNYSQDWTNIGLITANDNWAGVASVEGFRGDGLAAAVPTDPQTIVADDSPGVLDVNANQTNPDTFTTGGVAEFHIANPAVALSGSGTAQAPYIKLYLNTAGRQNVQVSYNVRDLDASTDDAIQQVALQYRVGTSGNFTNLPAGFLADATTGPSIATLSTNVAVTLPAAANNQSQVQVRIISNNATGNDEWVGIDDISVTTSALDTTIATDHFRTSAGQGVWGDIALWESSHDGINNWIAATLTPTAAANTITIRNGALVDVAAAVSADQLTIENTSTLFVNGGVTFTINDGPGTDLTADAGGFLSAIGTITNNGQATLNGRLSLYNGSSVNGNSFTYGPASILHYGAFSVQTTTNTEFPATNGPPILEINNTAGVTLHAARVVSTTVYLQQGALNISTNLTLSDGCLIQRLVGSFNGTPTFGANVDVQYGGSGALNSGTEIPAAAGVLRDLSITNGLSLTLTLTTNATVNNQLTLSVSRIVTGANTLSIASGGSVSRTSGYVIGNLQKSFNGTGLKTFEVGTANGYSPVAVNATAGTFPANFTVKAVQGPQPNFPTPTKALSRYWTLTGTGITADLTFNYLDPTDIPGTATEANFVIHKYNGAFTQPGGTVNTAANTASINGVASFSDWTLAELVDTAAPLITYSSFGNTGSTANRVLSVSVSDDVAVASGGVSPRIYFRKNAGAYFSTQCSLVSGNAQSGTYDCTVDNALIGGVVPGDVVGYFVIAQDTSGNVASNPSGAVAANVNSVTTPPAANTYTVLQTFTGAVSVGTGETITSLTNNGGLFQLMNAGTISGNTTVNITTHLTAETGTHSLNSQIEEGAGNYTIFFQASGGARLIEGSNATALINLNGADRVTFSGLAFGPLGLTFRNLGNGPTMRLINDASNNSILNCAVEGSNSNVTGVVLFSTGTTTGNDNNSITGSTIRDRSDAAGVPNTLIANLGDIDASNSSTTIANNQLFNFTRSGILWAVADNTTINSNTIFQAAPRTSPLRPIELVMNSGTNVVSQNTIRNQNTDGPFTGMLLDDNPGNINLTANRIHNVDNSIANMFALTGIEMRGNNPGSSVTMVNNMVSLVPGTANPQFVLGVLDSRPTGSLTMNHNSVFVGGTASGGGSWAFLRSNGSVSTVSLVNNVLFNNRAGGGNHFAIGDESANAGSWTSDYNLFAGTGATPANFFDYGTTPLGTPVDFAAWKSGPTARDANSLASIAGAGPFNVGNMFVSVNDLHLRVVQHNPAINAGTDVGVTTDFDGQMRPFNGAFDIGADEVQSAPTAADVSLSGRVSNTNGQGIRNIRVTVSGGDLAGVRTALTGSFGYFRFDGLRAGQTYVVNVSGKRYVFADSSRVITLVDELADVDFVAEPR